jgi:hypothetical protein
MGRVRTVQPELLIVAAFSRYSAALDQARQRLIACFGPIVFSSPPYPFVQTDYYAAAMGSELMKLFHVFEQLVLPDALADIKQKTNAIEVELARSGTFPVERPINLDPGLMNLGKFMLATTKDQAHRVYLRDGIFAEVTLRFQDGRFQPWPWTYADYRLPEVVEFMEKAREHYRVLVR